MGLFTTISLSVILLVLHKIIINNKMNEIRLKLNHTRLYVACTYLLIYEFAFRKIWILFRPFIFVTSLDCCNIVLFVSWHVKPILCFSCIQHRRTSAIGRFRHSHSLSKPTQIQFLIILWFKTLWSYILFIVFFLILHLHFQWKFL